MRTWAFFLKYNTSFRTRLLVDVVVYDRPTYTSRFIITYILFSTLLQTGFRLRAATDTRRALSTLADLFANANWTEREAMDMFGVHFRGHPDLRRLLGDYGFCGFPGRRDFPLSGTAENKYSHTESRVIRLEVAISTMSLNLQLTPTTY